MEKFVELFEKLDKKYNFTDEEVEMINEVLYGSEEDGEMYKDEYDADEEYSEEEVEYED